MKQSSLVAPKYSAIQHQMIEIPGGEIVLRDDRIKQAWSVTLPPFLLAKYTVTQDEYFEFTGQTPSVFKGKTNPVECISWKEAIDFCNLLSVKSDLKPCYRLDSLNNIIAFDAKATGYRLPTEAEWEYACKAGRKESRYGAIDEIAWYKENSGGCTHAVGQKLPNEWGLHDMLGNVWEWCTDLYDETVYGSYRIFRGGGWNDEARSCLATNRRRSHPVAFAIDDLGFRLARNLN